MDKKICELVEENDLFIGKEGDLAMASPLLECAGLFIYSTSCKRGILAHWQDKDIERNLTGALSQLKLRKPWAVLAGCGVPIECPITDSQTYYEVQTFLGDTGIPIKHEEVGLDQAVGLIADFSDGSYEIRKNLGSLTTSYFAVAERVEGTKIAVVRRKSRFIPESYEWMPEFAPSDALLSDYKRNLPWSHFVIRYYDEQGQHFRQDPEDFINLLERARNENIVLCCYERFEGEGTKCHRMLLYQILRKIAAKQGIDANFVDEVVYQRKK